MNFWKGPSEFFKKEITIIEGIVLFLALILIIPFFILPIYNNPSIDDYAFAYHVNADGFWKAQTFWYLEWTGRYFASLILSLHPLLIGSNALYKIISLVVLIASAYSIYKFIIAIGKFNNRIFNILLTIIILFCFLNGMPSLVQGIYWEPASVTYHLANILTLLLVANIFNSVYNEFTVYSIKHRIVNSFLIIAICGSNETSMLAIDFILFCFFVYELLINKKINKELVLYIFLAFVCSLVVILAPGNAIRDKMSEDINKHNVFFTIVSSFKTSYQFILHWFFSWQILISSIIISICYFLDKKRKPATGKKNYVFLFIAIAGYFLIVSGFATGYWGVGFMAPYRTINVAYWLFIFVWLSILLSILSFIRFHFEKIQYSKSFLAIFMLLFLLFLSAFKRGNYYIASKDLISGKAYIYNKEFEERDRIMKTSEDAICSLPSFSVYPTSIFNEDITSDETNTWNKLFAQHYKKDAVRVVFKEPNYSNTQLFNFESELNKTLSNQNTISNEFASSPPNSSILNGQDSYSATYSILLKDLGFDDITDIKSAHIKLNYSSNDSIINSVIVFSINDPITKKDILYRGKNIISQNYIKNKWTTEELFIPISKEYLNPDNKISVYVWNRAKSKLYVDDMSLSIY